MKVILIVFIVYFGAMKAKIKQGKELIFTKGTYLDNIKDNIIINFNNRHTYITFTQYKNHLFIVTTEGKIDIVFTGKVPILVFNNYEKDQLVLNII